MEIVNSPLGAAFFGFFLPMALFLLAVTAAVFITILTVKRRKKHEVGASVTPASREVIEAGARVEWWGGNLNHMEVTPERVNFQIGRRS